MHAAGGDRLTRLRALGLGTVAELDLNDPGEDLAVMGAQEARRQFEAEAGPALPGRAENG